MNRLIVAATFALVSLSPALASSHYEMTYHDNIRPNGHPRSDAVYNASLEACYAQTGLARDARDTPAFKDCMKTQGYSWLATKRVQDPASKRVSSAIPRGHFIDPDTGLLCYNSGGASICESPPANMTIRYTNKHGLGCTRTGAMSICSNL